MTDRTAEIWATRLQREVAALASIAEKTAVAEDNNTTEDDTSHVTPKHDNLNIASLPPFVKVDSHELDVSKGSCKVMFSILVEISRKATTALLVATSSDEKEGEPDDVAVETPATKDTSSATSCVFVTLDVSMGDDGVYYPFQKPLVILSGGEEIFPPKSTIQNGGFIDLDCDWTPSLHLSDAILNVALKIRESIRRGDPFLAAEAPASASPDRPSSFATHFTPAVDDISSTVSSFLGSLRRRKSDKELAPPQPSPPKKQQSPQHIKMGDVIDLSQTPYSDCAGMFSCKAIRRPEFVERAIAEAAREKESAAAAKRSAASLAVQEENEENESASGPGNYMKLHAGGIRKVAASGFLGASSFFRSIEKSIVQSTKAVLEENYLLVTEEHILEITTSKLNIDTATVIFVSPISFLVKLKFRRDESISLFFRQSAGEDPLIYLCQESYEAVQTIQNVLQKHGVKGKHTTTAVQRQIQMAIKLVDQVNEKEAGLEQNPSLENVNEIMDLYRQAAEKFVSSNDPRHESVLSNMHAFLAKPLVRSILEKEVDGSHEAKPAAASLPISGEDDDDGLANEEAKLGSSREALPMSSEDTGKQVDDMMKEVENLSAANFDEDLSDFMNTTTTSTDRNNDDDHDPVAELDAMLNAADKELNDLLESA